MDSKLPIDILLKIAELEPWAWRIMTNSIPDIGRYSLKPSVQRRMRKKFTIVTKTFREECYRLPDGSLYREDGPSRILKHIDGSVRLEAWTTSIDPKSLGKSHRLGGPAWIYYYQGTGIKEIEEWYIHDNFYRKDGPALIKRNEDGTINKEEWYTLNNPTGFRSPYRKDGPAIIEYYRDSGTKMREHWYTSPAHIKRWFLGGPLHRIGKPAYIEYMENGKIKEEEWYNHGKRHRPSKDGPAILHKNDDGTVRFEEYWENGSNSYKV